MTFPENEQQKHRAAFIEECRKNAWSAACNADLIAKSIEGITAEHDRLKAEDDKLAEDIKAADIAIDFHTVENREKRKAMQERRNTLTKMMDGIERSISNGQQQMFQLAGNAQANLELAKFAEQWEWKVIKKPHEGI